jgi:hypothetical protein
MNVKMRGVAEAPEIKGYKFCDGCAEMPFCGIKAAVPT